MSDDTAKQIERNIQEARKIVETGDAYERLLNNRDFRLVVRQGYFIDEAVRLVVARGEPQYQSAERQADLLTQIDGIASLEQYFRTVAYRTSQARKTITDDEATLEELAAEELTHG